MKNIKIEVDVQGIALVTIGYATSDRNLLSLELVVELDSTIDFIANDTAIIGGIITSNKSAFMVGADLKFMMKAYGRWTAKEAFEFSQRVTRVLRRLETCGKPIVAAINGLALGGGFEVCLACHRRVLVDDVKAVIGLPEVTVGLLPGAGGTQRLPRIIGTANALPLLLEGKIVKPAEALKLGLVDQLVPAVELLDAAREWLHTGPNPKQPWDRKDFWMPECAGLIDRQVAGMYSQQAARLASKTNPNYRAPIAILASVCEGLQLPFDRALVVESRYFGSLLTSPVARNIIRTSFVNKGAAEKLIRRPPYVPKAQFKRIGVLGAGMMGAGIAYVTASAGMDVVILDMTVEGADEGKRFSARALAKQVERGGCVPRFADSVLSRIYPTANYEDLADCDLVVEAVFENASVKADVTAKVQGVVPPDVLFATNTSTLPITQLAIASRRPDRFIGLHFFSPVDRMALVEVIVGQKTTRDTLAQALDFVAQLGKTPIIVNDSRGFYTSRVFQTFIHEGAAMLGEGVQAALIENAAKAAGFPVGPLALLDETTIDLPLAIIDQSTRQAGASYRVPCGTSVMLRMRNQFQRTSRKAGGGFYDYPTDGPKRLWKGLYEAFPPGRSQPDIAELSQRFLYVQAIESARCLEENVLIRPEDGDLGSVLGWSFPSWTGGCLSFIDTVGCKTFVTECDRLAQAYGERFQPSLWLRSRGEQNASFYSDAKTDYEREGRFNNVASHQ